MSATPEIGEVGLDAAGCAPSEIGGFRAWTGAARGAAVVFAGRGTGGSREEVLARIAGRQRRVAWAHQIHSARVLKALPGECGECGEGDALVSGGGDGGNGGDGGDVALSIVTADCVPVLLAGPRGIGAAHAGWRGIAAGVVGATVAAMAETPASLIALDRPGDRQLLLRDRRGRRRPGRRRQRPLHHHARTLRPSPPGPPAGGPPPAAGRRPAPDPGPPPLHPLRILHPPQLPQGRQSGRPQPRLYLAHLPGIPFRPGLMREAHLPPVRPPEPHPPPRRSQSSSATDHGFQALLEIRKVRSLLFRAGALRY